LDSLLPEVECFPVYDENELMIVAYHAELNRRKNAG